MPPRIIRIANTWVQLTTHLSTPSGWMAELAINGLFHLLIIFLFWDDWRFGPSVPMNLSCSKTALYRNVAERLINIGTRMTLLSRRLNSSEVFVPGQTKNRQQMHLNTSVSNSIGLNSWVLDRATCCCCMILLLLLLLLYYYYYIAHSNYYISADGSILKWNEILSGNGRAEQVDNVWQLKTLIITTTAMTSVDMTLWLAARNLGICIISDTFDCLKIISPFHVNNSKSIKSLTP